MQQNDLTRSQSDIRLLCMFFFKYDVIDTVAVNVENDILVKWLSSSL